MLSIVSTHSSSIQKDLKPKQNVCFIVPSPYIKTVMVSLSLVLSPTVASTHIKQLLRALFTVGPFIPKVYSTRGINVFWNKRVFLLFQSSLYRASLFHRRFLLYCIVKKIPFAADTKAQKPHKESLI